MDFNKNSKDVISKELGVKRFLKSVASAVAVMFLSAGLVGQSEGRFNEADRNDIVTKVASAGVNDDFLPPLLTTPNISDTDLMECNVLLSNILANAAIIPLAQIVYDNQTGLISANVNNLKTQLESFNGLATTVAPIGAVVDNNSIRMTLGLTATPLGTAQALMPNAFLGAGGQFTIQGEAIYDDAKLMMARLIVASALALKEAADYGSKIPGLAGQIPRGANDLSKRASGAAWQVINEGVTGLFEGSSIQISDLGYYLSGAKILRTKQISLADKLIRKFVHTDPSDDRYCHTIPTFNVTSLGTQMAKRAWDHLMERGHFWKVSNVAQADIESVIWARAARFNTERGNSLAEIHASFLVPNNGTSFAMTFKNVLKVLEAASRNPANCMRIIDGQNINIEFDISAIMPVTVGAVGLGALQPVREIKMNLHNLKSGFFVNDTSDSIAGSLSEAHYTDQYIYRNLGGTLPANIFLIPEGGVAPASAATPADVHRVRMGIYKNGGISTIFPK